MHLSLALFCILVIFMGYAAAESCKALDSSQALSTLMDQYTSVPSQYTVTQYDVSGSPFGTCLKLNNAIQKCWRLTSPAGQDFLLLQPDGNVVHWSAWYSPYCNSNLGCVSNMYASNTAGMAGNALRFKSGQIYLANSVTSLIQLWAAPVNNATNLCIQNSARAIAYDAKGNTIFSA